MVFVSHAVTLLLFMGADDYPLFAQYPLLCVLPIVLSFSTSLYLLR